jgi:hypothetical protein
MQMKMETPARLADATGANVETASFCGEIYRSNADVATAEMAIRAAAVRTAGTAMLDVSPKDRLPLIEFLHDYFRAGMPPPVFDGVMAEASHWADWATTAERKCYLVACYTRLSAKDQHAFLEWARGSAAA